MKKNISFLIIVVAAIQTFAQQNSNTFFDDYDQFVKTNVTNGKINYQAIKQNSSQLNALVEQAESIDLKTPNSPTQQSLLINIYNLFVIKSIVDNYPTVSPKDVGGFFENANFSLENKKYSLNEIEKKAFKISNQDPRLHFVLVCGANGCPPITNFAYRPEHLFEQLESQTKLAINDPSFIKTDSRTQKVYLSEIFKWYKSDFEKDNNDVMDFVNAYRSNKIDKAYKVEYYPYDWKLNATPTGVNNPQEIDLSTTQTLSNIQTYTPSILLKKGQIDLTLFNNLYTHTKSNWMGEDFSGFRETFFTSLFQFTYGVSKDSRFNVGFDINFKASGRTGDSTFSSITRPFAFNNTDSSRSGISSIGARIKFTPFKEVNNFSIQSTLTIPTIDAPEGNDSLYFVDWDRFIWWNQFFYDKSFGKFQIFGEVDLLFRLRNKATQRSALDLPASLFLSYFPTPKSTVYIMSQHVTRYRYSLDLEDTDAITAPANYTTSGAGFKYQLTPQLNIELLYTNFWRGENSGLGETFNLGLKFIR